MDGRKNYAQAELDARGPSCESSLIAMADIRPFRALRYDTGKVNLADAATQPYDKITLAMQEAYYKRSPANFIRFELPVAGSKDVYEGAREFLQSMRREGIIRLEDSPSFYLYEQEFQHPTEPNGTLRRRALIALGRLYDYSDGVVFRHEQTLTGPKKDRQQLLQTTRMQSGLLFLLYDDPSSTVEQLQPGAALEFVDDLGVKQRLWVVKDRARIEQIQGAFRDQKLFIADGHHRYETALALRQSKEGQYAEDFAMMALVNMRSEGLVVLPTHRGIFGLSDEKLRSGLERLKSDLGMAVFPHKVPRGFRTDTRDFMSILLHGDVVYRLSVPRRILPLKFGGQSCELDVEALHVILNEYFGITPADVTAQKHVRYYRFSKDAAEDVRNGTIQAAFLIQPVAVEVIRDRSLRGELMPQKSTDFYPKMNSGLTMYSWDESFVAPRGASI